MFGVEMGSKAQESWDLGLCVVFLKKAFDRIRKAS